MLRFKKICKIALIVLGCLVLLVAGASVAINLYVKKYGEDRILSVEEAAALEDVDCIIVLGASVKGGRPSKMLEDRLNTGIELYKKGASPKMLMSGDNMSEYYNEVAVMKDYAVEQGVASQDVFLDHAGFSTYESMYRAKEVFGAKKVLIVTQQYHLYRAVFDAERLRMTAYGVACADVTYAGQKKRDIRESLAMVKDYIFTTLKIRPTYLGEPISLDGDGDITN